MCFAAIHTPDHHPDSLRFLLFALCNFPLPVPFLGETESRIFASFRDFWWRFSNLNGSNSKGNSKELGACQTSFPFSGLDTSFCFDSEPDVGGLTCCHFLVNGVQSLSFHRDQVRVELQKRQGTVKNSVRGLLYFFGRKHYDLRKLAHRQGTVIWKNFDLIWLLYHCFVGERTSRRIADKQVTVG